MNQYRIYDRPTPQATPVLVATVNAPTASATLTGLLPGSRHYYHVRAVSDAGIADSGPVRSVLVEIDSSGNVRGSMPNSPAQLTLRPLAAGMIEVTWAYVRAGQVIAPTRFDLFAASNGAAFNFASATATATLIPGVRQRTTIGPYAHGTLVSVIVRAATATVSENNHLIASTRAVNQTPDAPASMEASV